jgi:hypothetical protein
VTDNTDAGTRREHYVPVDLNQPLVLEVHHPHGDVTVRTAARSDVLITHGAPGLLGDFGDEAELLIDAHDNRIEVRANPHNGVGWAGDIDLDAVVGQISKAFRWGGPWAAAKPGKVRVGSGRHTWFDVTIDVPQAITGRIEIHTASGDIRTEGLSGEIALHTASGDVKALRTAGDLALRTASGDLAVEGASGYLSAHTASGDVRVTSAQIDGFNIQTANGDILLDALLGDDGPCRAQTASGDVRLTLRRPTTAGEEPAATLVFHTVSGDAHVTSPFRKIDRRLWQSGAGDRGPRIEITTVSGDLAAGIAAVERTFVATSGPAAHQDVVPPAPPAPPASPAPPAAPARPASPTAPAPPVVNWPRGESNLGASDARAEAAQPAAHGDAVRLAVLEAVERGEIDVEEALRRLDGEDAATSP